MRHRLPVIALVAFVGCTSAPRPIEVTDAVEIPLRIEWRRRADENIKRVVGKALLLPDPSVVRQTSVSAAYVPLRNQTEMTCKGTVDAPGLGSLNRFR